jgi:hypothetical protein
MTSKPPPKREEASCPTACSRPNRVRRTDKALGLDVPDRLLALADEVVE